MKKSKLLFLYLFFCFLFYQIDNNEEVKKQLRALAIKVDSIKRNTKYKSLSITKKLKQDRLIGSKIKVSLEYI